MSTVYAVMQGDIVGKLLRTKVTVILDNRPSSTITASRLRQLPFVMEGDVVLVLQYYFNENDPDWPFVKVLAVTGEVGWVPAYTCNFEVI